MKPKWPIFLLCYLTFYYWINISWSLPVTWLYSQYTLWWNVRNFLLWGLPATTCYLLLHNLINRRNTWIPLLLSASLIGSYWAIKAAVYGVSFPFWAYFFKTAHLFFSIPLFAAAYYFIRYNQYQALREKELEANANSAELSFLLSQFNPHFLINCLNNIYVLVYNRSAKALTSFRSLSSILTFLYGDKHETIPMDTELKYITEYISLQRLRFDVPVRVSLLINDNGAQIAPLLLIPFVENAFKHGDVIGETLELTAIGDKSKITFYCRNAVKRTARELKAGIGLRNITRRLELIYPQKHSLKIENIDNFFTIKLTIWNA